MRRQRRVGKDGGDFELLKLRTMVVAPLARFGGTYKGETAGWRA